MGRGPRFAERLVEIPFAERRGRRRLPFHDNVRVDTDPVNAPSLRRVIFGGGQAEARPIPERQDGLDGSLSERLHPDDDRAAPVLKRPGDDLGRAGAPLVHQGDDGIVVWLLLAVGDVIILPPLTGLDVHDQPIRADELLGHLHRSGQQANRVVPAVGAMTVRRLSLMPIWMPTPPNSPLVSTCTSL